VARITICMAAHNAADTVELACRSIINQTQSDWELVVVDDGSTDNTTAIVEALNEPRIVLIRNQKNQGLAASLNTAVDRARGFYVGRMDADDIAFPDRLALQLEFMDANPGIDLVGGNALVFDDKRGAMGCTTVPVTHSAICASPARGIPILHPTWFGKTTWFTENRYDETFRKAQDYELLLRTMRDGGFANLPQIVLAYRYPGLSAAKRRTTRSFMEQALRKHRGKRHGAALDVARLQFKSLADSLLEKVGLSDRLTQARLAPVSEDVKRRWNELTNVVGE
jgi:glycosyltransferase involved in cell wall biosynthesis